MRKYLLPLLTFILCACTEKVDLRSRSDYHDYLAVEATLTDRPEDPQQIVLSRTISYPAPGRRGLRGRGQDA